MSATYVDRITDPNGVEYEIRDSVARQQLAQKVDKQIVSLQELQNIVTGLNNGTITGDQKQKDLQSIFYVPTDVGNNYYDVYIIVEQTSGELPNTTYHYIATKIATTQASIDNFSTKGHTHLVTSDVHIEDHEYTPEGTVSSNFTGNQGTTSLESHQHTFTASGTISGTVGGTTNSGSANIIVTPTTQDLDTTTIDVSPATSVTFSQPNTTVARNTFASNSSSSYDADRSIFNNISVSNDGVLSFVHKKLDTVDTFSSITGTVDASKVLVGGLGTVSKQNIATGALKSGSQVVTGVSASDSGHTHTFTSTAGSTNLTFSGTSGNTSSESHNHTFTPGGTVESGFTGLRRNLKHNVDNRPVRTEPDDYDPEGNIFDWYGIDYSETDGDPAKTRVGNLNMHKTLPIQTGMRRCILSDDGSVNYYLDPNDSTKRAGSQEGWVTSQEKFMRKVETDEIRDETETIEEIKGNSVAWNQVFTPFNNYYTGSGITISGDGSGKITIVADSPSDYIQLSIDIGNIISGHKYLCKGWDYSTLGIEVYNNSFFPNSSSSGYWIITAAQSGICPMFIFAPASLPNGTYYIYPQLFDLTQMGIDSFTTVDQVEAYLKENFGERSYYPYTTGDLLSYGGKMVKWNQLVQNGDFSDGITGWSLYGEGSYSVSSGILSVTPTSSNGYINHMIEPNPNNHKAYYSMWFKGTAGELYTFNGHFDTIESATGDWQLSRNIHTVDGNFLQLQWHSSSGDFQVKDVMCIDLTLMFGAGNEPDLEDCEKLFTKDYYDYDAGTWRNLISTCGCGTGQKTVGFNQWDEQTIFGYYNGATGIHTDTTAQICSANPIRVLPNTYYFVNNSYVTIIYFDANMTCIGYSMGTKTFTTSNDCCYILINIEPQYGTTYNHDICINISDPKRNGEYKPYNAHTYNHDITTMTGINPNTGEREVVFETGMKSAGSVYDRLYNDGNGNAVCKKMCGDVDMGTLNWTYDGGIFMSSPISDITTKSTPSVLNNIVCSKYQTVNQNEFNFFDKAIIKQNYSTADNVVVRDSSYSDATTFKSAMDGVELIYEFETPITYTDLQWADGSPVILPFEIEVEHNGTIENTPNITSGAPVMCAPDLTMKKYVLTQGANLDGSDGQVMVEIPEHWRKVYRWSDSGVSHIRAMISPYTQDSSWTHIEKCYMSAYEASIGSDGSLRSVCNIDKLEITRNSSTGNIEVSCDATTATTQSDIHSLLPTTNVTMDTLRTAARKRNNGDPRWNMLTYDQYLTLYWLFTIEYATTNSQAPINNNKTLEGYMQGGLGDGVSNIGDWGVGSYQPLVPCGLTNCLGNNTGEITYMVPAIYSETTTKVNSYRGIELPFSHIWKFADGIKYNESNHIFRCFNFSGYSSAADNTGYIDMGAKSSSSGWVTEIYASNPTLGDYSGDITPTGVGGDSSTYYCDYYWTNTGSWFCCLLGGVANGGSYGGLSFVDSYNGVASSSTYVGSRLCFN